MTNDRVFLATLQWRLLAGWAIVVALCVLFFLGAGEVTRAFPGKEGAAWGWFVATLVPPLALAAGAVVDSQSNPSEQTVSRGFALAATLAVGFYGVLVLLTPLCHGLGSGTIADWLTKSGLWLGPLQSIADIFLASVFPRRSTGPAASTPQRREGAST